MTAGKRLGRHVRGLRDTGHVFPPREGKQVKALLPRLWKRKLSASEVASGAADGVLYSGGTVGASSEDRKQGRAWGAREMDCGAAKGERTQSDSISLWLTT